MNGIVRMNGLKLVNGTGKASNSSSHIHRLVWQILRPKAANPILDRLRGSLGTCLRWSECWRL